MNTRKLFFFLSQGSHCSITAICSSDPKMWGWSVSKGHKLGLNVHGPLTLKELGGQKMRQKTEKKRQEK